MSTELEIETKIGLQQEGLATGVLQLGASSIFTCPECHGVLLYIHNGRLQRFRCHTGHAFSPQSLGAALIEATENALGNALRALKERTLLLEHQAQRAEEAGQAQWAATRRQHRQEARHQAVLMRQTTLRHRAVKTSGGAEVFEH